MTKIQITQEQEKALETYKSKAYGSPLDLFIANSPYYSGKFSSLSEFSPDEFAKLLYVPDSYEVINPIKVGSYVRSKSSGNVYKVKAFTSSGRKAELEGILCTEGHDFVSRMYLEGLELITKEEMQETKERNFWRNLGREVGEFREGDRLKFKAPTSTFFTIGEYFDRTNDIEVAKSNYSQGNVEGFFPAEAFISFEDLKK